MLRILFAAMLLFMPLSAQAETLTILALGDSLTAGYGLDPGDAFPAKLEAALKAKGHDVRVLNAGVSGDTASAARTVSSSAQDNRSRAAIVELGANDALRGQSPVETRAALDAILTELKARGIPVLIAGMRAPPNLGEDYGKAFEAVFANLAKTHGALIYPFFLEGVAADPALNQPDGIHPNAKGVDIIVERILPSIEALIAAAAKP
jgi:acyl-CoA thioesterase I